MPFDRLTASEAGRRGGLTTKQRMLAKNPNYYSQIGYKSGKALLESRGKEYYAKIGSIKKGQGKHYQEEL